MPVSNETSTVFKSGNGSTTAFTFAFPYVDSSDIYCWIDGVSTVAFTVTAAASGEGGTVTFNSAPASGTNNICIARVMDFTQELEIPVRGNFSKTQIEAAYDRLHMLVIQMQEQLDRIPKFVRTDNADSDLEMEEPEDGKGLRWDSDGNIVNTADDLDDQIDTVAASATAAAASASAASSSASAASTSAAAAATSASAAAASATEAAEEVSGRSQWRDPITIGYAAMSSASTALNALLGYTLAANEIIDEVYIQIVTRFLGGSTTAVQAYVGITTDGTKYSAGGVDAFSASLLEQRFASTEKAESHSTTTALYVRLESSHALNTLTQGSLKVWLKTSTLPS